MEVRGEWRGGRGRRVGRGRKEEERECDEEKGVRRWKRGKEGVKDTDEV